MHQLPTLIDALMPLRDSSLVGPTSIAGLQRFETPGFTDSEARLSLELVLETPKHFELGEGEYTNMNKTGSGQSNYGYFTTPNNPEPTRIQKEIAARTLTMKSQTQIVEAK